MTKQTELNFKEMLIIEYALKSLCMAAILSEEQASEHGINVLTLLGKIQKANNEVIERNKSQTNEVSH